MNFQVKSKKKKSAVVNLFTNQQEPIQSQVFVEAYIQDPIPVGDLNDKHESQQLTKVQQEALNEDANIFDYDAAYIKEAAAKLNARKRQNDLQVQNEDAAKKPRYVNEMLRQAKTREMEEMERESIRLQQLIESQKQAQDGHFDVLQMQQPLVFVTETYLEAKRELSSLSSDSSRRVPSLLQLNARLLAQNATIIHSDSTVAQQKSIEVNSQLGRGTASFRKVENDEPELAASQRPEQLAGQVEAERDIERKWWHRKTTQEQIESARVRFYQRHPHLKI